MVLKKTFKVIFYGLTGIIDSVDQNLVGYTVYWRCFTNDFSSKKTAHELYHGQFIVNTICIECAYSLHKFNAIGPAADPALYAAT